MLPSVALRSNCVGFVSPGQRQSLLRACGDVHACCKELLQSCAAARCDSGSPSGASAVATLVRHCDTLTAIANQVTASDVGHHPLAFVLASRCKSVRGRVFSVTGIFRQAWTLQSAKSVNSELKIIVAEVQELADLAGMPEEAAGAAPGTVAEGLGQLRNVCGSFSNKTVLDRQLGCGGVLTACILLWHASRRLLTTVGRRKDADSDDWVAAAAQMQRLLPVIVSNILAAADPLRRAEKEAALLAADAAVRQSFLPLLHTMQQLLGPVHGHAKAPGPLLRRGGPCDGRGAKSNALGGRGKPSGAPVPSGRKPETGVRSASPLLRKFRSEGNLAVPPRQPGAGASSSRQPVSPRWERNLAMHQNSSSPTISVSSAESGMPSVAGTRVCPPVPERKASNALPVVAPRPAPVLTGSAEVLTAFHSFSWFQPAWKAASADDKARTRDLIEQLLES